MKVLVPLDGSDASEQAMLSGLELLKQSKPDVVLLCVRADGFDEADDDRRAIFEDNPDDEIFASEDEAQTMLDAAAAKCAAIGVKAGTKICTGSVPKAILEEAATCDVLLMHHLSRETIKEKLRMSRLEGIVRSAECAVLLI